MKRAGALARTSEHDRAISGLLDLMAPALGVVGGPGDNPRRSSHVRTIHIDRLDAIPN